MERNEEESRHLGEEAPSEDGVTTCRYLCQDKTKRKYRNTLDSLKQSFFTSTFNVIYKRGVTLFIDMSALERKRGRIGA